MKELIQEMENVIAALAMNFDPEQVKWRAGVVKKDKTACMALAYIDARAVMDRLDNVVGAQYWQDTLVRCDGIYVASIGIALPMNREHTQWIWKSDAAGETSIEGAKGGASDAFKRAAVKWGVGRYLYDMDTPWVPFDNARRIIHPDGMEILNKLVKRGPRAQGVEPESPPNRSELREPSGSSGTKWEFITETERKALYRGNFQALEAVGFTKQEIEGFASSEKFAPLDASKLKLNVMTVENIKPHQLETVKEGIRQWIKDNQDAPSLWRSEQSEPHPEEGDSPG